MICDTWIPVSERDQTEVRNELERVLASPQFRNSRRYPAFLRHVVEKALSGEVEHLKERTLGVEVFHRAPDYDTSADPVVRFSAGEVRRRIAQYYKEKANRRLIEIELPVGTYVPHFSRANSPGQPLQTPRNSMSPQASKSQPIEDEQFGASSTSTSTNSAQIASQVTSRTVFFSGVVVGILVIALTTLAGHLILSRSVPQPRKSSAQELWAPLLADPDAVIISVGRTQVDETDRAEPSNATIEQHILRPDARISLAAVEAVSQVAGFLETQYKQFRIREAYSNTLQDLHRRPVTLVSGYNNIWTMRLLKPLRFHLERVGSLHYIVDREHPERRDWTVDFDMPYLEQTADYAIVGRFYDPTTEGPVLVVAGIGSNGSQAAGEFVVSPESLQILARSAPHHSLDQNFEAVLKVEVIGGNTGATSIVASQFW